MKMVSSIKAFIFLYLTFSLFLLSGCSGGGGGGSDTPPSGNTSTAVVESGVFLDSAVEGMHYLSGGQSGFTDNDGTFKYEQDQKVRFEIGGILIGETDGKSFVTPIDLVPGATDETNSTVLNITRFLLAIDDDNDDQDGLKITEMERGEAADLHIDFGSSESAFENDSAVQNAVARLTSVTSAGAHALPSTSDAQKHLRKTISKLTSPRLIGSWGLIELVGAPSSVDEKNSVWTFKDDDTYYWFLSLGSFKFNGSGAYRLNLAGTEMFVDGVLSNSINQQAVHPNILDITFIDDDTFSFKDDEGDKWTYRRLKTSSDSTPPDTAITSGPTNPTNATSATFAFTATETGSTFECSLDSDPFVSCTSPQTYSGLSEGSHNFQVQATDAFGNADASPASYDWTIDITPPDTSITNGPADPTNLTTATFAFSATETGSTFECSLDGGAFASCASPMTYSGLAEGDHSFQVQASDAASNTDASPASANWTINLTAPPDITPPDTIISSGPANPTNATSATFAFTATETGSTFECSLDNGTFASCTSPKTYSGLAEGDHTFQVQATDAANNTDASPAFYPWTIDTTPPDTTITSGPDNPTNATSATFAFTATETGSIFECSLDGGAFATCSSPKTYSG